MSSNATVLGVIGGSGLYGIPKFEVIEEINLETPFGTPSSPVVRGRINGTELFFLARHGKGHVLSPTEVPYRANVFALKSLGVNRLLSVSAVGSLREEIEPGHLVLPDQVIDRTRGLRPSTFFGKGIVVHVALADPFCGDFRTLVKTAAESSEPTVHYDGTLVCMEGPQFSTRAESFMYRSLGASLVGMTVLPEAKLAREASMCYATLALATDYDCWYEGHDSVTVEAVLQVMKGNAERARTTVVNLVDLLDTPADCSCSSALRYAVVTQPGAITRAACEPVKLLLEGQIELDF